MMSMTFSRVVAVMVAVVALASGCGRDEPPSPRPSSSAPASTSTAIAPADVDPFFAGTEGQFRDLSAVEVDAEGAPLLRAVTGHLVSGDGQAFVEQFLADLTTRAGGRNPPQAVASQPSTVGDYPVTYFNVPAAVEGYAYADGRTVVIAYNAAGPPKVKAAKEALLAILRAA